MHKADSKSKEWSSITSSSYKEEDSSRRGKDSSKQQFKPDHDKQLSETEKGQLQRERWESKTRG